MLDQYWMRHAEEFFTKTPEEAIIDPLRTTILKKHLACAALESPLTSEDASHFGPDMLRHLEEMEKDGLLINRHDKWLWSGKSSPHQKTDIRSASEKTYTIIEGKSGVLLGTLESSLVFSTLHPGAIYLHQGENYAVDELDIERGVAVVRPFRSEYYTVPKKESDIVITDELRSRQCGSLRLHFGTVEATSRVIAYQKKKTFTNEVLSVEPLDLPPQTLQTEAVWFEVEGKHIPSGMKAVEILGSLHAIEHSMIGVLPIIAMCDRWDVGGLSTDFHPQTGESTIFIYDGYPGGIGISETAYARGEELVSKAYSTVKLCGCRSGCPSCIQSPKCGNWNEPLSKGGSISVMKRIIPDA